ncbi:hypothetical protein MMP64_20160 [Acinetobacter sp. ANC 5659]|uniref:hypothetical protein n=1 Tax=Acinetobacter higginsii TaxID=70347 RepID=UPI0002D00453|nr:hypothetical protein [Acinetobacter higginsii]ENX64052.1 hypothetical protein F885_00314 [Acinetobacter higginsii]MCH7320236.1 hypothetical protein [Acinetobacter higginsii]
MYKLLITGVLLAITSTYALAKPNAMTKEEIEKYYAQLKKHKTPKGEENKMSVRYDTKKKKVLMASTMDYDMEKQGKCADRLFTGKETKKLDELAKGKTGEIDLIYDCSH